MSHDQLFKTLLKGFFYDFLRLFLPAIAAGIEPERITFLDTTDFTTQPEGDYRVADIVARVDPRDQPPSVVILHTEVETEPEADFPYRMWEYNALLTLEHQPPVISIALLPFMVGQGVELARYTEIAFGQEYTKLEYWRISLRGLDAAAYLAAEPALGAAFAALMRPGRGGRVDLKAAIFARLRRGDLAPGTRALFFNFVQTYLQLNDEEQAEFARRLAPEGDVTMETLERTWLDEQIARGIAEHAPWTDQLVQRGLQLGIEQGLQQGIQQGMQQGLQQGLQQGIQQGIQRGALQAKRDILMRQLQFRFGATPPDLEERVAALDEPAIDRLLDRVIQSDRLEAFLAALSQERR